MKRPAIFPRGHTLVEVTIALALGLIVTVGAYGDRPTASDGRVRAR
jgi:prepilin-type N-terminal cleavage/methylation domain-containing protein